MPYWCSRAGFIVNPLEIEFIIDLLVRKGKGLAEKGLFLNSHEEIEWEREMLAVKVVSSVSNMSDHRNHYVHLMTCIEHLFEMFSHKSQKHQLGF